MPVDAVRGARVVLMTAPAADVAERIVRALVEERLAACGNIVPGMTSIYWWQGEIQHESEVFVMLKTTAPRLSALLQRAVELHPYDVPELLVLDVQRGYEPYLRWLEESTAET
jgi:periplasmic divalent cation tolerance protein